jgi:epoxyqueuosine reductase
MKCQVVCPLNRGFRQELEYGPNFTEEETRALLDESRRDGLPASLKLKFAQLGVDDFPEVIPRNLRVLLERDSGGEGRACP